LSVLSGLVDDAPVQPALSLDEALDALPPLELPLVVDDAETLASDSSVLELESPELVSPPETQVASPNANFLQPLTGEEPDKT